MTGYPTPRCRLRTHALIVTLVALTASLLVVLPVSPAAAEDRPLAGTPLVTWNMQGANEVGANTNKWRNTVLPYARQFPIVMLQEAGAHPAVSATRLSDLERPISDRAGSIHIHTVQRWRWNLGTYNSTPVMRNIYFLHTQDGRGGRVNLALVVNGEPDEVNVVHNPIEPGRTALGVRFGSNWYFTVHGLSGGGGDSAVLLEAIDDQVTRWAAHHNVEYDWTVGGDFNVTPDRIVDREHFPVARTLTTNVNTPTHNSGNRYDYFVTTDFNAQPGEAWVPTLVPPSDHRPVMLGRLRAAAEPPSDLRLMPVGDSITEGLGSSNHSGFRDEIQEDLGKITAGELLGIEDSRLPYEPGYKRDLVGSRQHGDGIPDTHHEGWPGYSIDQIAGAAPGSARYLRPNVVTLLAGTNDMVRDIDVAGAPARLSRLIDQIYEASPGVAIVVGTLPPSTNPVYQGRIDAYNAAVERMLDERIADGDHLVRVDLSAVTAADLADEVHPADAGYRKIAYAFSAGIRTALAHGWVPSPAAVEEPGKCNARGGYEPRGRVWNGLPGNPDVDDAMKYADIDGDNRDDIVWISPTGAATAWLNRGNGGSINWVYRGEIAMGTGLGPDRVFFADLNDDRMDDYIVIRPNNVIDAYYNRGGDTVDQNGWHPGFEPRLNYGRGTDTPVDRIRFADIDGDGRADYVRLLDFGTKVDVIYNRGGDTPGHDGWQLGGATLTNLEPRTNAQIEFADLNCDRREDYIALDSRGVPTAWFNTGGTQWFDRGQIALGTGGVVALPELDGDGRADWVKIARNGALDAWLNKGGD